MPQDSATPFMALVIHDAAAPSVGRCMSSAASGMPLIAGPTVADTMGRLAGVCRLMVVGPDQLDEAVAVTKDYPNIRIAVLTPETTDRLIGTALRVPQIVGLLAWLPAGVRPWELSYITRRAVAPEQHTPPSSQMLLWGGSTVTWHPRTSEDRERAVRAVELVATRFGITRRVAATAADAAHELLMNAMYDAPIDSRGRRRYAGDRQASIALEQGEVPTMQLTVDSSHLALDVSDPFGRLPRQKVFGGILRGRSGAQAPRWGTVIDDSEGGAGLGLFNLFHSSAVLRVEVAKGRHTLVSWMVDRAVPIRDRRTMARSLHFVETQGATSG
ncbi:MAG: hypothetical protein AAGA48_38115 [Myxococcota bacterium]